MKLKLTAITLSLALLSGCSSIVSDNVYNVAITTTPSEASFIIKNEDGLAVHSGTTPSSVSLDASSGYFDGETYTLIMNKEGYAEKTVVINSSLDGWYIGNILFGGLIGLLIVDPATGAMFKLPKKSDNSLDKISDEEEALTITMLDSIPENERSSLIPIN